MGKLPNTPPGDEPAALAAMVEGSLRLTLTPGTFATHCLLIVLGPDPIIASTDRAKALSAKKLWAAPPKYPRESPKISSDTSATSDAGWGSGSRLAGTFRHTLFGTPRVRTLVSWGDALLPYYTLLGAEWAVRLARQLRATLEVEIDLTKRPQDFDGLFSLCERYAAAASLGVTNAASEMLAGLFPDPPAAEPVAALYLYGTSAGPCVDHLSGSGQRLLTEPLADLFRRVAARAGERLATEAAIERAGRIHCRTQGDAILEAVSPRLAKAVSESRRLGRPAGTRIASTRVRGMPAEIYLFVDTLPSMDQPCQDRPVVTLEARRAHEEYVLGNSDDQFFYYPPCQLVARVSFEPQGGMRWRVERPRVRALPGSPIWIHPYVGAMAETRLGRATLLKASEEISGDSLGYFGDPQPTAQVAMSDEGSRILPADCPHYTAPVDNDMCLPEQDLILAASRDRVRKSLQAGIEPDLAALTRTLWEIVRVGLTHGHERNTRTPRASLEPDRFRHLVIDRSLLRGRLARRVFRYNP